MAPLARWVWCSDSRRPQAVVMIEAAKLALVIRAKFDRPVAEGTCSGLTPCSEMVSMEMKKALIATP